MPSKRELRETVDNLTDGLNDYRVEYANLEERLADLELALEDVGWLRLAMTGEQEFSRDGLRKINTLARMMYLKNPLVKRGVEVQTHYVFGQGISISAEDESVGEFIQGFLADSGNQAELTSHQARMGKETELHLFSNLFFCFFTDGSGRVRVRTIPCDEIDEIITNPEDRKEPRYYKRMWQQDSMNSESGAIVSESRTAYYPDWRYSPPAGEKLSGIGGCEVMWESPVYHVKTGGLPDMLFGVSEVYASIDWARAYKEFLENWSAIVKAYARFAWSLSTKGGSSAITAAKTKLESTITSSGSETNPPPVTGSTFIANEGVTMQPFRTAGATTSAEDGRRILLMVAASVGLPETFFGDVSVGTLATAKSLDRPTELKMVSRQTLWADIHRSILDYVVIKGVEAHKIPGRIVEEEDGTPRVELMGGESVNLNVTFPPILEHDVNESVGALVQAATLGGQMPAGTIPDMEMLSRMLLNALGEENADAIVDKMFPEGPETEAEKMMVEAVKDLRDAISRLD